jgi:hypothetical protein
MALLTFRPVDRRVCVASTDVCVRCNERMLRRVAELSAMLICPLQSGPSTILVWTLKEKTNGQETRA